MYTAYDRHGHACGFVSRESMENDLAYQARLSGDNQDAA